MRLEEGKGEKLVVVLHPLVYTAPAAPCIARNFAAIIARLVFPESR
jgi:hypothetical protein